jgi:predicted MFS family arabinose efflux permease
MTMVVAPRPTHARRVTSNLLARPLGLAARPAARSPRVLRPLAALSLANALSLSGNVVATVAIPWLVLDQTGSAALAALSVVSGAAAAAIGALAAGRVVDAVGRTRTSAIADVVSGLALVPIPVLAAAGRLELWHLIVLVFAGTLVDAAGSTARQSLVPVVATSAEIGRERANSLFTGTEHVGYLVGAPLAGLVIATLGAAGAIWIDVATFAASAALVVAFVRRGALRSPGGGPARDAETDSPSDSGASPSTGSTLRDAARLIRHDPALRALVIVPTLATGLIGPLVPILLPVLARDVYGDPVALGVLVGAFGAGGLAGAFGFGLVAGRVPRRALYLSTFAVWPFVYATLALGAPLAIVVPALALLGAVSGSLVSLQATIRQERTPPALLPRVVGLSTGPVPVVAPVAVLVAGLLIDRLGIANAIGLLVVGVVAVGIGAARSEGVRRFDQSMA